MTQLALTRSIKPWGELWADLVRVDLALVNVLVATLALLVEVVEAAVGSHQLLDVAVVRPALDLKQNQWSKITH